MTLIGVTQRVVHLAGRGEHRDVLDQNWAVLGEAAGVDIVPVPNRLSDPVAWLVARGVDAVVLSGGNNLSAELADLVGSDPVPYPLADDVAPERDRTEFQILAASSERGWPVLGICRGMQLMNVFHGGRLRRLAGHAGTSHPTVQAQRTSDSASPWLSSLVPPTVASYHDFGLTEDDTASDLVVVATAEDGSIEAFAHKDESHAGIMWHPERDGPPRDHDIALLQELVK
jgi:N5-(cytidine 5'-diphosphoramidyl)-L-glutamine hydrolase